MQKIHHYLLLLSGIFLFIIFLFSIHITFLSHYFSTFSNHTVYNPKAHAMSVSQKHNTFSTAFTLAINTPYKKRLFINEKEYYYIAPNKRQSIGISIRSSGSLTFKLYSQIGQTLPFLSAKERNHYTLQPQKAFDSTNGCFLQVTNQSEKDIDLCIKVFVKNTPKHSDAHEKKKNHLKNKSDKNKTDKQSSDPSFSSKNSSEKRSSDHSFSSKNSSDKRSSDHSFSSKNSSDKQSSDHSFSSKSSFDKQSSQKKVVKKKKTHKNTSSSKKLSTFTHGNVNLNPHFLLLRVNNVYKPDFYFTKEKKDIPSSSIYSTQPSVAIYHNGKIYARSAGISILYYNNQKENHTESIIIRVL